MQGTQKEDRELDKDWEDTKKKYWKRLLTNFKDPYFIIKIWQRMCVLAFFVGILIGAIFTQNYYIGQVNSVFEQAREQDGCFNNFFSEKFKTDLFDIDNFSWDKQNVTPILVNSISNNTDKPK